MEQDYIYQNLPHNFDAEIYILGSIIIDNSVINGLKGRLTPEDFYSYRHNRIFKAMLELDRDEKVIDITNLQEYYELSGSGSKESIRDTLIEIMDQVPTSAYVDSYVEIIKEKATERLLLKNIQELQSNILNNNLEYNDILTKAENDIFEVIKQRRTSDTIAISDAAQLFYDEILKRSESMGGLTGLDTHYKKLNEFTNGLQPGEFIVLAARPGVGKTGFALNLARNVAQDGKHVGFFSLEMSVEQIMQRMFAMESNVDSSNIRTGQLSDEEKVLLTTSKSKMQNYSIYFDESGASTIGDIRNKCRQLNQTMKLDLVIIDYLQLINADSRRSRQEDVSEISRNIKRLSRELHIPVIALSQLSRSIEQREDKMPVLADLRESGSIEQDADIVMFLFDRKDIEDNDEAINAENQEEKNPDREIYNKKEDKVTNLVLSIAKNRQGRPGHMDLDFYGNTSRFVESKIQRELNRKHKKKKSR